MFTVFEKKNFEIILLKTKQLKTEFKMFEIYSVETRQPLTGETIVVGKINVKDLFGQLFTTLEALSEVFTEFTRLQRRRQ